jgi:hypothetical protein
MVDVQDDASPDPWNDRARFLVRVSLVDALAVVKRHRRAAHSSAPFAAFSLGSTSKTEVTETLRERR